MNTCTVSGWIQGGPEHRITSRGLPILDFEILIEGQNGPYLRIGYLLRKGNEVTGLRAGMRVQIDGAFRHHATRGFFIAVRSLRVLDAATEKETHQAEEHCHVP